MTTLPPILFANFSTVLGGQELYLRQLAGQLVARHGVVADFLGGPIALTEGVGFRNVTAMPPALVGPARRRALGQLAPDLGLVLLNGNRALYQDLRGPVLPGRPRVYVHHSQLDDAQGSPVRRRIRRLAVPIALRRIDHVIRVCRACLPLEQDGGRLHTIANGVDAGRFAPRGGPQLGTGTAAQPLTAVMVGALTRNKNQELAVRALARIDGWRLVLAGDGPDRDCLGRLAQALRVASRVELLGQVDDPAPLYARADLQLVLSRFEAAPLALLEGMASGLAVVATRTGGIPEMLAEHREGLLIRPDLDELVRALRRLVEDAELRSRLGASARRRVECDFTLEQMVTRTAAVLATASRPRATGAPDASSLLAEG